MRTVLALLVLVAVAHGLVSTFSVKTASRIPGGSSRAIDLTSSKTSAYFYTQFDQDVYIQEPYCQFAPAACTGPSIAPCCVDCLNGAPVPSPNNAFGCICAVDPTAKCLDAVTSSYTMTINRTEYQYYDLGFIKACHNVLITVKTITGNQNLYANGLALPGQVRPGLPLNLGYPANVEAFYAYDVGSELPASDALSLCATPGDSGDFKQSYRSYAQSAGLPYPHLYISVYGYNEGQYTIEVQEATAALPRFNLPVSSHYFFLPAHLGTSNVSCAGTGPVDATSSLFQALYPDADPAFKSLAVTAGISPATSASSNAVAFSITLAGSVLGQPQRLVWANPANCSVNWSNTLRDSSGVLQSLSTTYVPSTSVCDLTRLRLASGEVSAASATLEGVTDFASALQAIVLANTYAVSDDIYACLSHCGRTPGSSEFNGDACCNTALRADQCCLPRNVAIQVVDSALINDKNLNAQCATDACGQQSLTSFANLYDQTSTPSNLVDLRGFTGLNPSCQAFTLAQLRASPGFSPSQILICEQTFATARCTSDAACLAGAGCNLITNQCYSPTNDVTPIISCVASQISTNLLQDLSVRLSVTIADPNNINITPNLTATYQKQGCFQYTQYLRAPFARDASLDSSETVCLSAPSGQYCNWDFTLTRSRADCTTSPFRSTTGYCAAACNSVVPDWCPEASNASYEGCFTDFTAGGAASADCAAAAGVYIPTEDNAHTCYLDTLTETTCVDPARCPAGATQCPTYCYFPALTSATCDCAQHTLDAYSSACQFGALTWDATKGSTGTCYLVPATAGATVTAAQCANYNVSGVSNWWRGGSWYEDNMNSVGTCTGGYCTDGITANELDCLANTTVTCSRTCPGCTRAQCLATGYCNSFDIPAAGACLRPAIIDPSTALTACQYDTDRLLVIGCLDVLRLYTSAQCTATGGTYITYPTTQAECLSYTRCQENIGNAQVGNAFIYTNKSGATCQNTCGGRYVYAFSWLNASASDNKWFNFTWRARGYDNANTWSPVFDRSAFQSTIDQLYTTRFAQIASTDLSCRYDRSNLYLKAITCDCVNPQGSFCYSQISSESIGSTRFCSGFPYTFTQSPVQMSSFLNTTFTPGCTNVNLGSVNAPRFKQAAVSLYSSLFLKTIVPNPYRFINNSKGIQVAQLVGDGVVVELSATSTSALLLCIEMRSDIKRLKSLKVADFALNTEPYRIDGFKPQDLNAWFYTDTSTSPSVKYICAFITRSATYFPVVHSRTWKTDKYIDTLDRSKQVIPFFVAGAIYLAIFLFCIYRLTCVFLWTLLGKGDASDKGKMLLPKFLLSILSLYLVIRGVYLILVPVGKMREGPVVVDLLFAELPTYIYFSLFMLMVFWWIELYHRSTGKSVRTDFLGRMKPVFIGVNVLMYSFFIIVLVLYNHYRKNYEPSSLCGVDTTPSQPRVTDLLPKIYKCVVAGIAAIIALGFVVYGGMLLWTIGGKITVHSGGSRQRLISLGVIAGVCSASLIMQCVLLLVGAFAPFSNTRLAIALQMIAELSPAVTLLYFMRQPPLKGHGFFGDLFFCCFENIDDASTMGSQSATRSTSGAAGSRSSGGV